METGKREQNGSKKISRKEAIKKGGSIAALTAATMLFLTPKESAANSADGSNPPRTGEGYE